MAVTTRIDEVRNEISDLAAASRSAQDLMRNDGKASARSDAEVQLGWASTCSSPERSLRYLCWEPSKVP